MMSYPSAAKFALICAATGLVVGYVTGVILINVLG
jgi:Na+/glutamate symporter